MVLRPDARHWKRDHAGQVLFLLVILAATVWTLLLIAEEAPGSLLEGYDSDTAPRILAVRVIAIGVDGALAALLVARMKGLRARMPLVPFLLAVLTSLAAMAPLAEAMIAYGEPSFDHAGWFSHANFGAPGACALLLLAIGRSAYNHRGRAAR